MVEPDFRQTSQGLQLVTAAVVLVEMVHLELHLMVAPWAITQSLLLARQGSEHQILVAVVHGLLLVQVALVDQV
jgi:hypothetical protein